MKYLTSFHLELHECKLPSSKAKRGIQREFASDDIFIGIQFQSYVIFLCSLKIPVYKFKAILYVCAPSYHMP
jgi:hypothetical protein